MKRRFKNIISAAALTAGCLALALPVSAQNSLPAPGSGSISQGGSGGFGPGPGPAWGGNPGWGGPWNSPGWNSWNGPIIVNTPMSSPNWQDAGTTNVVAVGYDAQGVYRAIPLTVSYQYNGVQYDVTVVNAWDPWTNSWDYGVYDNAYNTSYYLRGTVYNFYTILSTGTYYFNL